MPVRFCKAALALVGLLTSLGSSGRISAAEPPLASEAASPPPCTAVAPDAHDLPAAYAYDLESPDVLRFVRFLTTVPAREQNRIFEAAIGAAKERPEQEVQGTVDSRCPRLDAAYGALRAGYVIVNDWTLRELKDAARFQVFDAVVATAVSALALGDELTPEQRATATRPFVGFDLQAPARAASGAPGVCSSARTMARAITLARPGFPPNAAFAQTLGKVNIKVGLSETGDVRSAAVSSDTLGNAIGSDEMRRESIFAAATTIYAPEIRNCVAQRGFYLYQAEYTAR